MTKYQVNTTLSSGETINSGTIIIPDATTIPIANSTTLGGVMPVNKTDGMTQEVGVDSTGKLYTAPGGGGGSNTVVYDYSDGTEFTAADVRSMYDNYSNGKRVLINYILPGIGKVLIEVTSMSRNNDGSGIVGSGKANMFGFGVSEFTLTLNNDTVQLGIAEYKFNDDLIVTVNYDNGVKLQTYYWDSLDGWMQGPNSDNEASPIAGHYDYVIVKTECNLSSSNSPKGHFKVNGKCYFDGIPHDAPVRLHPGDTIEPIEHCSPTITLSAIPAET